MRTFLLYLLFFAALLGYNIAADAQATTPPVFLCAQTQINGDVGLTWSASGEACGPFLEYNIYASNTLAGPYFLLATIPSIGITTYVHVGASGSTTTWYYYIEAVYDCPGYTMTLTDTLDNLDPIEPEIDYVTVTASQSQIFWFPSPSPETNSYVIYRDNAGFTPIDTVYGRFTTNYTDVTGTPDTKSETYTIAARDSCGNIGLINNHSHHTIYLTVQQVNCSDQLSMSWNLYDTWDAGVSNYEIYADVNGAGPVLITTLSSSSVTYTYTGFSDGDHICLYVRAIRSDNTAVSLSNEYCSDINIVQPAQYTVMRNATYVSSSQNDVEFYPDPAADLEKYVLERSTDNITYSTLASPGIAPPAPATILYSDFNAHGDQQSYYYKVSTFDSCGTEMQSGTVRTILLKGDDNADFTNTVNWNAFEIAEGNVTSYNVYRDDGAGMNLITNVPAAALTYTDDVSAFVNIVSTFCYQVEALYDLNAVENGVSESLTSLSNIKCVEQGPRVYVPNAIVPDGVNNVFKPVIIYGENEGYSMQIFDRYGAVIFESHDMNDGWTGEVNNEVVPLGTYAYMISFTATNGQQITKKGNVTVIR